MRDSARPFAAQDVQASVSKVGTGNTYRGGLALSRSQSSVDANSAGVGVTVLGSFVAGGAPMIRSHSSQTRWTWKGVIEPASTRVAWTTGASFSRFSHFLEDVPNPAGVFQFEDLDAYVDWLAGKPTGAWFVMRGNGKAQYAGLTAAPFLDKVIVHSDYVVIKSNVRADYQLGDGTLISPRLAAATAWRGWVLRVGAGLYVQSLPGEVFVRATARDRVHLRQFMASGVSFTGSLEAPNGQTIHATLEPGLRRPRELLSKASVQRRLGRFTPSAEYTWVRGRHLLGSKRSAAGTEWLDVIESNRSIERHRLHAQLRINLGTHMLMGYYQWTRSRDNTDGVSSFPERQDDLRGDWARTAGVSPHSVTLVGTFAVPRSISLTVTDLWRSSSPYNITTGLDLMNNGLFNDRGGRARNSGDGPGYNSLSLYGHKRILVPEFLRPPNMKVYIDLGVQAENLLGNRNYIGFGSVVGSPNFGRPLGAFPSRSVRVSFNVK